MPQTVLKRQNNSRMCVVCGLDNPFGLKAAFYELENGSLAAHWPTSIPSGVWSAILSYFPQRTRTSPESPP